MKRQFRWVEETAGHKMRQKEINRKAMERQMEEKRQCMAKIRRIGRMHSRT